MDLSKLPKLSNTKGESSTDPASPVGYEPLPQRPTGIGGDIWISLIMGIVFLYLGANFAHFAAATVVHRPFHTGINWTSGEREGTEVSYFDLEGFTAWSEMGMFVFGLTLLFETLTKTLIAIKPSNLSRFALVVAMMLTFLAVILNLIACIKMFSVGITPIISCLAVAFGGWILVDEWATLGRNKKP